MSLLLVTQVRINTERGEDVYGKELRHEEEQRLFDCYLLG